VTLGPGDYAFAPAVGTGAPGQAVVASEIVRHPLWEQLPPDTRGRIRFDIALMRLSRPLDAVEAAPLPLAAGAADIDERGFVVSFRRPVLGRDAGTLVLQCEVRSGESGSPFLARRGDGRLVLAGVVVARAVRDGAVTAIAVDPLRAEHPLGDLLAILDAARPTTGGTRPETP